MISIGCCILLLTACQTTKKNTASEQKQILQEGIDQQVQNLELPSDVADELYADLSELSESTFVAEKRIDISARDVDAGVFFSSLIRDSSYSVAIHPNVSGKITLSLKQVTLPEALAVIEDMYGYEIKLKGNVYHIYPVGMRIASFTLDYLFMNRMGGAKVTVLAGHLSSSADNQDNDNNNDNNNNNNNSANNNFTGDSETGGDEFTGDFASSSLDDGTEIVTVTSTNYWAYLDNKIRALLGGKTGRDVIVSPMSGTITIRAYPDEIRNVKEFLENETDHLNRQVILEMQLIEVTLSDRYQQGVSWQSANASIGGSDLVFDSVSKIADNVIQTAIGGGGALTVSKGSFSAVLSLLKTQGDVNVLSKPRITAMNNQKALIKIGGDEYFVTDVSTTTVTGNATTSTPNIELTPFFSGIAVDVTPKINNDDSVLLHIHPSIIDIQEQNKTIDFGTELGSLTLPLAKSEVRESDTVVKSKSGDVIIIGGLMSQIEQDVVSKTPILGDIPWLGEFFTNRDKKNEKVELIILVKPQIVKQNTWKQELVKSSELIEKWYPSE